MKQFVSIVAMVFAVLVIGGCGASSGDPATTQSQPAQEANPAGAIEKIYETIEMRGLVDAQDEDVTDRFQMNLENIESYNIRYSLGLFGVADTFIIKPAEGKESDVWDDLAAVKNARIEEFEKYDILGAYEISKDAEIYTRGDYVIMVMHQDNDAAKKIIGIHPRIGGRPCQDGGAVFVLSPQGFAVAELEKLRYNGSKEI